jgi:ABC transport system ATP-binding/permease protein
LLLIPQMILSGLLFSFDKLNSTISTKGKVPLVADMMTSRWAYEALAVYQFKNNSFEEPIYIYDKIESQADYKSSFFVNTLTDKQKLIAENIQSTDPEVQKQINLDLELIRTSILAEEYKAGLEKIDLNTSWSIKNFTPEFDKTLTQYFDGYRTKYLKLYNDIIRKKEQDLAKLEKTTAYNATEYKNKYYNEDMADLVKNVTTQNRIIEYNGQLIQQINPIFADPKPSGILNYRTHFFAPVKNFLGMQIDTFYFNLLVIWAATAVLYVLLYLEVLRKFLKLFSQVALPQNVTLPKGMFTKSR